MVKNIYLLLIVILLIPFVSAISWSGGTTNIINQSILTSIEFLNLTDTPNSYSGADGKILLVSGNSLIFANNVSGGGGDTINIFNQDLNTTNNVNFNDLILDGNLTVGDNVLFVDAGLERIGIGTSTPQQTLNIIGGVNITGALNVSETFFVVNNRVGIGTLNREPITYVQQDNRGHWTSEIVVPSYSKVLVYFNMRAKLSFSEESWKVGCLADEADNDTKPRPTKEVSAYVTKTNTKTYYQIGNDHHYRIIQKRTRTTGAKSQVYVRGLEFETFKAGSYQVLIEFELAEASVGTAELTMRVEDEPLQTKTYCQEHDHYLEPTRSI